MRILSVHRKLSVLERCPSERLVRMERCPYGEVFVWRGVRLVSVSERCPYGKVSVWCPYYRGVYMERFDCTVLESYLSS